MIVTQTQHTFKYMTHGKIYKKLLLGNYKLNDYYSILNDL